MFLLKVGQNPAFQHTGRTEHVGDGLRHALLTAQERPGIPGDGNAIFVQGRLNVSRPSVPFVGRLADDGDDLDALGLPFGELVHEAHVLGSSNSIIQSGGPSGVDTDFQRIFKMKEEEEEQKE